MHRGEISPITRERLLALYYHSYHSALENLVTDAVATFGYCLLIDCHSFGTAPLGSLFDHEEQKYPDFCIGTDAKNESGSITGNLVEAAKEEGWSVSLNYPYAGVVVPTNGMETNESWHTCSSSTRELTSSRIQLRKENLSKKYI